ncbi:chemotaxis protein CheB [Bacteriovorax sp. PP10]|uniref:protein-glutamate methylesterase n=1 Tax=Bacteriovorax antarcticus TaxID=3088717 RepID=A0ABU5VVY8_9BACT|nr:chemotaxis protein CheB [Bacteriovorax sp. PP10]MEA9356195.1 chemotaxis protein CheB [Bacteriovorax sp. PP10]
MMANIQRIQAIFIGTSAGGVFALNKIFRSLPDNFRTPIIVVLHLGEKSLIPSAFYPPKGVKLVEADEKEIIKSKHIYFAPAGYHLLVENDFSFSLTNEEKVQYARPSLDVTMDSLAQAYQENLLGIVLTGANEDGAEGLATIKRLGGLTVVQDLQEAEHKTMPAAAIKLGQPDFILSLKDISSLMIKIEGTYESRN